MKYLNKIGLCGLLAAFTACEKDLPMYSSQECMLNFEYENVTEQNTEDITDDDKIINWSFILNSTVDAEVDTIWLTVTTMGYLKDYDRPIALEQVMTGDNDAQAGVHYVSFNDADLCANYYYIPANAAEQEIPVVVLRDESLQDESVTLKIALKENEYFSLGYPEFSDYTLVITDKLSKPTAWDVCSLEEYFGEYGEAKHSLMIEWTGQAWDDDYIYSLFYSYYESYDGTTYWFANDDDYMNWLSDWFQDKLEAANAERLADPEIGDVYREKDGTEVDFTPASSYWWY